MARPSHTQLLDHARELVEQQEQWLIVTRRRDGVVGYALPSRSRGGLYHLVSLDPPHCDCTFARVHGLTSRRIGRGGVHEPCAHLLAVTYIAEQEEQQIHEPTSTPI